ncbi:hypothetical protein XELAEV_18011323mg [Xenopus laevis]|uniref:Uncharacterized protein n=1 Tax=Xenopus laevis TaxID=8355 RepID=A0A974HXC2_XENLA|nr:hypothetical protein XELAEV_18011323mg [Xenopus laevis]
MEGKSSEVGSAEEPPVPSVAKLAGIFGEQRNSPRKEIPPPKPTRRKPPCSLPLNKLEVAHNDERVSPPACLQHKIKVKSSPLIEKLQANLAFPPVVLLPGGGSPKSPGPKVMTSPFSSPPLTPGSPGIQSRSSESDEAPVSFENPPEGAHTLSNAKVMLPKILIMITITTDIKSPPNWPSDWAPLAHMKMLAYPTDINDRGAAQYLSSKSENPFGRPKLGKDTTYCLELSDDCVSIVDSQTPPTHPLSRLLYTSKTNGVLGKTETARMNWTKTIEDVTATNNGGQILFVTINFAKFSAVFP